MTNCMGLPEESVDALRAHYLKTYGTTLRGLQHDYQIDADEYLAYVHDLPLNEYIQPDPGLRQMLLSLPLRRLIFTNADSNHARRVLATLELQDCFQGIIDVRAIGFLNKPDPLAYQRALDISGVADPKACVLLDDAAQNTEAARRLGFTTVLVNQEPHNGVADYQIPFVRDLPNALPGLWLGS